MQRTSPSEQKHKEAGCNPGWKRAPWLRWGNPEREVFIVDDDPAARDALAIAFTRVGLRVVSFVDGVSFIAGARQRTPACIILDLYMPGSSGLDLLREIDATHYPAPTFVMSGRGDIPSAVEAIKNGAADFFEKRLHADEIVERVCAALGALAN